MIFPKDIEQTRNREPFHENHEKNEYSVMLHITVLCRS
jgi:hypothetical protein